MSKFKKETTTVWSFPTRSKRHSNTQMYRGNFAPQIPRNIILWYSNEGDVVLDPMVGSGTTLIETGLLKRKGIGLDINPNAIKIAKKNLLNQSEFYYKQKLKIGDARNMHYIDDCSIDLIIIHPPYLDIVSYSNGKVKGDFSNLSNLNEFLAEFDNVIEELYRVLKFGCFCTILIGDTRKNNHYIPLSVHILLKFLKKGFLLKEEVIKIQHNCSSTKYWQDKALKYNFLLIMHEHLYIFRKPKKNEKFNKFKYSSLIKYD